MGGSTGFTVFAILIDDTGNPVLTIYTRLAIGTILANGLDNGGYCTILTILAFEANLAVIAILAGDHDCLSFHVICQLERYLTVCSFGFNLACRPVEGY